MYAEIFEPRTSGENSLRETVGDMQEQWTSDFWKTGQAEGDMGDGGQPAFLWVKMPLQYTKKELQGHIATL